MKIQKEEQGLIQSLVNFLKSFGMRLLIHCIALIVAMQLSGSAQGLSRFAAVFSIYLGLICLIARGTSLHFAWLMPTLLGFTQVIIASSLGLSFVAAIFIGGLQSYVQRLFIKKFKMGLEWVILPFLCLAFPSVLPIPSLIFLVISFIFLTFIGIIADKTYQSYQKKQEEAKKQEEDKKIIAEREKNKQPFDQYRQSIKSLYQKRNYLPQNLQDSLISLGKSAELILDCMKNDARDVQAGEKFLARYLPATHAVLDNYNRHSNSVQNEAVTKALNDSQEILLRLEGAFAQEHSYLLQNDVDDFSADLKVLDTLLKMDGK